VDGHGTDGRVGGPLVVFGEEGGIVTRPRLDRACSHRRESKSRIRWTRPSKTGTAAAAIGPLTPGMECFVLSMGQFSLIDAFIHLVEEAGPCDVDISVWTVAHYDMGKAEALIEQSSIRSMRWLVDRSFPARQPSFVRRMRDLFGDECIRVTQAHCKFIVLVNESWNLAVRTSMNLNENPRLETIEISDDPGLAGFLRSVVDAVFEEVAPGDLGATLTALESLREEADRGGVTAREIGRTLGYPTAKPLRSIP
jgi:hypothetical protein